MHRLTWNFLCDLIWPYCLSHMNLRLSNPIYRVFQLWCAKVIEVLAQKIWENVWSKTFSLSEKCGHFELCTFYNIFSSKRLSNLAICYMDLKSALFKPSWWTINFSMKMQILILYEVHRISYNSIIKRATIMLRLPLERGDPGVFNDRRIKFAAWIQPEILTFIGSNFKIKLSKKLKLTIFGPLKQCLIWTSQHQTLMFIRAWCKMSTFFWQEEGFESYIFPDFLC